MTEKIIFDNGSTASKLLQHELKDAKVVKVTGSDLVQNFTQFDSKKEDQRIYLPFTSDDLVANGEQLRKDIASVEGVGFRNQVVLPYEGNDEKTIKYRAIDAGIIKPGEVLKGEVKVDQNKPYTTVKTGNPKEV
jgi:hypothetical protein